ncbi:MAG: hypothetical protein H0T45_04080 [Pyrinomonadaceae bacterium]|nr:hypothetical protein [Pyrinomonadaceae bacterium]MDQ3135753.1 hypothetical protein [Acidobacteriota bacterium]
MIVEGFDNAWHILSHWSNEGFTHFVLESEGRRVPFPRQCQLEELPIGSVAGVDYFPLPDLSATGAGDNPDPERPLTAAEIILATAIAEGWEPVIQEQG